RPERLSERPARGQHAAHRRPAVVAEPRDLIVMYANGLGAIAIGRATEDGVEILDENHPTAWGMPNRKVRTPRRAATRLRGWCGTKTTRVRASTRSGLPSWRSPTKRGLI